MNLLKSSIIVSSGTLSSRILGFVRDLLMARFLGAGISSDIFFIGLRIPNAIRNIFGEGAFNLAFVPLLKSKCDGNNINEKSLKFIENSFAGFMFLISVLMILFEIFMPEIIKILAPALLDRGQGVYQLAVCIGRILMPYILFISYMTFMGAVLNSIGKFAAMAFAPGMLNIGYILAFGFVYFCDIKITEKSYIPSYGMLLGGFLQFLVMYFAVKKLPFKIKITLPRLTDEVKVLFFKFIPTFFSSGIVVLNGVVSVFLASSLQKGAVSYMFYTDRLVQLPHALFGIAIATVLLPDLSYRMAKNKSINKTFSNILTATCIIASFCTAYIFCFSELIINTLFERGLFDRVATQNTAAALSVAAWGLPAIMALKIIGTVFYAQGNTKTPTYISAASFCLNLILCLILMEHFSYVGLVGAGVIAAYFTVFVQTVILIKNKILKIKDFMIPIFYYFVFQTINILTLTFMSEKIGFVLNDNLIKKLLYLFFIGIIGLGVMMMLAYIFKLHKNYIKTGSEV